MKVKIRISTTPTGIKEGKQLMSLLDAKKDIFHKLGDLAQKALFQWELIELEVLNNE